MTSKVCISILRSQLAEWPKREDCSAGDIVVMVSGDLMVWSGYAWFLLPGRFISVGELKEFLSYVQSGWPLDSEEFIKDLGPLIEDKDFLHRAAELCPKIGKEGGLPAPPQ